MFRSEGTHLAGEPSLRVMPGSRVLLLVLLGLFSGQWALARTSVRQQYTEDASGAVLEPGLARILGGPYSEFFASLQWVDIVFRYADGVVGTGSLEGVADRMRLAIALDPEWMQPIEFAGLVLDGQAGTDLQDGIGILRQGVSDHPGNWRIRLYLAMLLQSANAPVDSVAAVLLPLTNDSIEAPAYLRRLPITMLALQGKGADAVEFLARAIKDAEDPLVRFQFEGKIADLLRRTGVDLGVDQQDFVTSINQLFATEGPEAEQAKSLLIGLLDSTTRDAAIREARRMASQWRSYRAASLTAPESGSSRNP